MGAQETSEPKLPRVGGFSFDGVRDLCRRQIFECFSPFWPAQVAQRLPSDSFKVPAVMTTTEFPTDSRKPRIVPPVFIRGFLESAGASCSVSKNHVLVMLEQMEVFLGEN